MEDGFHGHCYCGQPHSCSDLCECEGICKVSIEMVQKEEEEFVGARGTFKVGIRVDSYKWRPDSNPSHMTMFPPPLRNMRVDLV